MGAPKIDRRTWLVISVVAAACIAGVAVNALRIRHVPAVALPAWVLLQAIAQHGAIKVRIGGQLRIQTWSAVALIVALDTMRTPWVPIAVLLGVLCSELVIRDPLPRLLFNVTAAGASASAAALAYSVLPHGPAGGFFALCLAASVEVFISHLALSGILSAVRGTSYISLLLAGTPVVAMTNVTDCLLGCVAILLARHSPLTLALIPPVAVCLLAVYRHSVRSKVESALWQRLDQVDLAGAQLDEAEVITKATTAACELFRADSAEVIVDPPQDSVRDGVVEPLPGPAGPLGVLRLTLDGPAQLTEVERRVLVRFAHGIGSALINARLHGETIALAQRNAYQATHDDLTGLANRPELQEKIISLLNGGRRIALLILDLKHIKEVNETLGLAAGDVLLQQVAERLRQHVRAADVVARVGGDEFAVVLADIDDPATAETVALSLLDTLAVPVEVEGLLLTVEATAGVACAPEDAATCSELMQRAHVALQLAQASGRDCERWTAERDPTSVDRIALLAELKQALSDDELVLHYQPKMDIATGRILGSEVLVRWQHPRRGLLAPGAFIPAVEASGLVHAFTLAVLDKSLAQHASWTAQWPDGTLAVNLSARNLLDRTLPQAVARLLARHGVAASRLVLEITETSMMSELEVVEDVLSQLRDLGVQLSVDDFGTGYSSLTFLQKVAVNEIKVDRAFVDRMLHVEADRLIVRATIDLAHGLGLRVVAEGVEIVEQLEALRQLGCDQAQGYYLARPMPPEQILEVVAQNRSLANVVPIQANRRARAAGRASGRS